MKTFLLTSGLFLFATVGHTQAIRHIDINNVDATIANTGTIFTDYTSAQFIVPKPTSGQLSKSTIYGASAWMGGVANGQLYLQAETYRQSGKDLQYGPISSDTSSTYLTEWNRLWKINKSELETFITMVQNNEDVSFYTDILSWPAKGNVYGSDITMNDYAPFVDVDSNGTYTPLTGDYPLIKGDMCIYSILNDNIPHTESQGQPLQVDIHRMVYAYSTNDAVSNTVFVDYKIVNKSARNYEQFVFSSWVDFDLGNYNDDYVGTDTLRNMVYALNGDSNDEGVLGYGTNPPAQACVLLNAKMASSMYYNNTSDPKTGNPSTAAHYYNYMAGLWLDGTPKTAAGAGYNTNGPITAFSYSGDPCTDTGWWEGSASITPGDRRIIASIEPQVLPQNGEVNVSMAFVFARAASGGSTGSFCLLQTAVDEVVNWYNGTSTGMRETSNVPSFAIFPNPAQTSVSIEGPGLEHAQAAIVDITGKVIKTHSFAAGKAIAIDDLHPGLYLVKITTENGTATKRLVIE